MSLVRLFGTKSACRVLEYQISNDTTDDGKPKKLNPKDSRRWDKIADNFIEASDDFDIKYEKILTEARKKGLELNKELSKAQGDSEKLAPVQMRINIFNQEVQEEIQELEDTIGQDEIEIDIDENDLEFVNKFWNELNFPRERSLRKQLSAVTDMLSNPKKLVKSTDGKYVVEE